MEVRSSWQWPGNQALGQAGHLCLSQEDKALPLLAAPHPPSTGPGTALPAYAPCGVHTAKPSAPPSIMDTKEKLNLQFSWLQCYTAPAVSPWLQRLLSPKFGNMEDF